MRSIFAALILMTAPAAAQTQMCDSEQAMLDMLYRNFGEFKVWVGDAGNGGKAVLTRADGAGNWTLLQVSNGRACIVAEGRASRFDKGV